MTREVLQQALDVLRGCADHPDADDAVAAIVFELAQTTIAQEPVGYFIKSGTYQQVDAVHKHDDDVFPLYAAAPPAARSFKKMYEDIADGIEIERLKMRIEELEAVQPVTAQGPTSAEYAQGYAAGFNDACRPAEPDNHVNRRLSEQCDALGAERDAYMEAADKLAAENKVLRDAAQPVQPAQAVNAELLEAARWCVALCEETGMTETNAYASAKNAIAKAVGEK